MRTPCVIFTAALLVLLAGTPILAGDEPAPDWGYTDLDQVRFGTQLTGPRLSHYDLRGKIVVCYHWGITCPISTGAFPYMNRLNAQYRDKGVEIIGFQVRRDPDVLENNVTWFIEHLGPTFPMAMLSNDWEWPARILPWVIVYNHRGERIFGGNLRGIEKILDDALEDAPDILVGGPYEKLGELASRIAKDRDHAGAHMETLRGIASEKLGGPAEAAEAERMLANMERFYGWQVDKAVEDAVGPVEEAAIYRRLASMFEGDELGRRAAKEIAKYESDPGFARELSGHFELTRALRIFRRLPPAGRYAYNMDYSEVTDESVLATRSRMIVDFRVTLSRIVSLFPDTQAAKDAEYLLYEHEVPALERDAAERNLERARKLLGTKGTPYEKYEGYLLVYEVTQGYHGKDEVAKRAGQLLASLDGERADTVADAVSSYHVLNEAEVEIREQVRLAGSALPRKEADEFIRLLEVVAEEAGASSRLAERTAAFTEALLASYGGPAHLGVAFDRRYEGEGLRIQWVYPATAAEKHGLAAGDVILGFEGADIAEAADLTKSLAACKPGQKVELRIRRGENDLVVELVLGRRL